MHIRIYIRYLRVDPKLDFQQISETTLTLPSPTSKLLVQNDIVTGARFTCTCFGISHLAFQCMRGVTNTWHPMT